MISQLVPKGCRGREQKRPQERGHAGNDRGGTRWTRWIPACPASTPRLEEHLASWTKGCEGQKGSGEGRRERIRSLVVPAKAGTHASWQDLDARLRGEAPLALDKRARGNDGGGELRYRSARRTLSLRNCPVRESGLRAICSGVPVAMMRPPLSPPSGPKSMTQSAFLIMSRLCSMTMTVLPLLVSSWRTPTSFSTSAKCRPVVGSSRMYNVLPAVRFPSSAASLTR